MNQTTYERGMKTGEEKGERKGVDRTHFELAEAVLERKFGPVSTKSIDRLRHCTAERLREIILTASEAKSLAELGLVD